MDSESSQSFYNNYAMNESNNNEKEIEKEKEEEKNMEESIKKKLLKKILNPEENDNNNKTEDVLQEEIDIFDKKYKPPTKIKSQILKKSNSQNQYSNINLNNENKGFLLNNEKYKYHNNNIIRIERLKESINKFLKNETVSIIINPFQNSSEGVQLCYKIYSAITIFIIVLVIILSISFT